MYWGENKIHRDTGRNFFYVKDLKESRLPLTHGVTTSHYTLVFRDLL